MTRALWLLLVAVFCVVSVFGDGDEDDGDDYYVSPYGDDTFDGKSKDKPFKTIKKAASVYHHGDTIHLEDGRFEGPDNWAVFPKPVTIQAENEGLASIVGESGGSVIPCLNLSLGGDDDGSLGDGDEDEDGDDFQISGIQFLNCYTGLNIEVADDNTYTVSVDNCLFYDSDSGLELNPQNHTLHEISVTNSKFYEAPVRSRSSPNFYVKDLSFQNCQVGSVLLATFSGDLTFDTCDMNFGFFVGTSLHNE